MARSNSNEPIEPMDLANMRANGVRSLLIWYRNGRQQRFRDGEAEGLGGFEVDHESDFGR